MPISRQPEQCDPPIELHRWSTNDADKLAGLIAWLLLGRHAHVAAIVNGNPPGPPEPSNEMVDEAISHLDCPTKTRTDNHGNVVPHNSVVHRDGWMFQFISWIVAIKEFPGGVAKSPQARKADKGFDGLLIELDGSTITAVMMMEDKATDDPRGTVSGDVWNEFTTYEGGKRDGEMTSEAATILKTVPNLDVIEATRTATWFQQKRYRVSVATSSASLPPQVHTFEGYDTIIAGTNSRRLANLLVTDDMRAFFEDISQLAIVKLNAMRP